MQLIKKKSKGKGHIIVENVFELINLHILAYLICSFPINTIIPGALLEERQNETASTCYTVQY